MIAIAAQKAGKVVAGRVGLDRRALPFTGLSALVHIGLLAAVGLLVPSLASAESADASSEQNYLMQQYLRGMNRSGGTPDYSYQYPFDKNPPNYGLGG